MVGADMADRWWNSPNKAFDGRTPAGQWLIDFESVYMYLMRSAEGDW